MNGERAEKRRLDREYFGGLLKEMELKNSHATVTLDPKGQMTLRASISGFNPTKRTHNPITLNYTHQENMLNCGI